MINKELKRVAILFKIFFELLGVVNDLFLKMLSIMEWRFQKIHLTVYYYNKYIIYEFFEVIK